MAGNRFRVVDSWHHAFINSDNATVRAADEIIEQPEKHLLT